MSGICGVWAFDGQAQELGPVLAELERRGPDGTRRWRDDEIALGHSLLATTPEALVEQLPLTDAASGCTITADVRLDNRDELLAALGLDAEVRTIGDGELILRAYLHWGDECPKHLLGDFAFAIWDSRTDRLFCARDHMGMRQFNYCHVPGELFAFATVDTALLALDAVPKAVNQPRVADLIADLEGYDRTSTFFAHIHRLAPAHSLTVETGDVRIQKYWFLEPGPRLEMASDDAYAAGLSDVLAQAIRCRLRSPGDVGAMLSGGLDSSSIVAIAARMLAAEGAAPLKTLSAVDPDTADCAETAAIHSVLTIGGVDPILIRKSDFGGKRHALIEEMEAARNPFEVHMTMLRTIYMTARDHGLKVVLDGGAGDVILTADNRIAALLSAGRFAAAAREARATRRFWGLPPSVTEELRELLAGAWVAFVPLAIRSAWRRLRMSRALREARPEFAAQVDFPARRRQADGHVAMAIRGDSARRAQAIVHPHLSSGRERYDQVAGSFGIEARDPFMDLRVIRFCLSLPPEQMQHDGWPKIILRRAMARHLPEDVAWRRGKEHLGGDFTLRLLKTWPEWSDGMTDRDSPLRQYVSPEILERFRTMPDEEPSALGLRLFALDRFLRRHGS